MSDKTPQEIFEQHEARRLKERADRVRWQILAEKQLMTLPVSDKILLQQEILDSIGYDPNVDIRGQSFEVRIVYHKRVEEMHKDPIFLDFYGKRMEENGQS